MIKQLEQIFNPGSIAVIGASGDPQKMSYLTIDGFIDMGFKGNIYPVSRNDDKLIHGFKVFTSIDKIPGNVDLAIIVVPPPAVTSSHISTINESPSPMFPANISVQV